MKRIVLATILAISASIVSVAAFAQPAITIEEPSFDFGTIQEGPEAAHDFIVMNKGDQLLKIDRLQTSCGCTSSKMDKMEIKPGEKATLTALYDTANRPGPFKKEIRVFSNDPVHPEVVAAIQGTVQPRPGPMIGVEPTSLNLGTIKPDEERILKIAISNMGEKELVLHAIVTRDGSIKLLNKDVKIAVGERVELELHFSYSKRGSFREVFLVQSNDPRRSTVSLVITGVVE